MSQVCVLDDHRLITVGGTDRVSFLQGQLTQDITRLEPGQAHIAGWADARGRLLWCGQLFVYRETCCLLVPAALVASLLSRLRMFVLRARAQVAVSNLAVVGVMGDAKELALPPDWEPTRMAGDDSRSLLVGPTAGVATITGKAMPLSLAAWTLADVRAGIPEITAATSGEFVPQMVNLDLLDGISFSKGCYTGQEIVARTKYLGRVKRRMLRFSCMDSVNAGEPIYAERGPVGQVVRATPSGSGSELLAVVYLDDLTGGLYADEERSRPISRLPLPYAV